MNIIEWHKKRWKERRVRIGYMLWLGSLGSSGLILGTQLFGIEIKSWAVLISSMIVHFFGMYLVFRYDLFAKEVDDAVVSAPEKQGEKR